MRSGYEILWTNHALSELSQAYEYLEEEFTTEELRKLSSEIEFVVDLISRNPFLFPLSEFKGIRRAVILKHNTLYYRLKNERIEVVSFFNNRRDPENRNL